MIARDNRITALLGDEGGIPLALQLNFIPAVLVAQPSAPATKALAALITMSAERLIMGDRRNPLLYPLIPTGTDERRLSRKDYLKYGGMEIAA